jgi:hypothetical protein
MTKIKKPDDETLQYIKDHYFYNYENGTIDSSWAKNVGSVEETHSRLICKIKVKQRKIRRCHIVWFLNTEEWPISQIDHEDRNSLNDEFENLRQVDDDTQQQNKHNYSGYKGFSVIKQPEWEKIRLKQWRARNQKRGINLGYFQNREDAIVAIDEYWKGRGILGDNWDFSVE